MIRPLVFLDQDRPEFESVTLWRVELGIDEFIDAMEGSLVVDLVLDDPGVHGRLLR